MGHTRFTIQVVARVSAWYIGESIDAVCSSECQLHRLPSVNMAHSSIGNMTNTLIETGSRHMQQCRTNYDVLAAMAGSEEQLLNGDDPWCMGKDELAVTCNKHIDPSGVKSASKYAYPSVVTTIGATNKNEKTMLAGHYHFMGQFKGKHLKEMAFKDGKVSANALQYREFIPVGYSVGRACAHGYKGDTVASVQIGGFRTVLNGALNVQTGDFISRCISLRQINVCSTMMVVAGIIPIRARS